MHPKYQEAFKSRLEGKSYREIKQLTGVPKSTLSFWFKNLELPLFTQTILKEKGRIAKKQLVEFNRQRTQAVKIENQKIRRIAINQIRPLSKYELTLIGATLYWGEGQKRGTRHMIDFVNSDADMIKLYLRFLREIIQIPEEKIKVRVQIHSNVNEKSAVKFWSKLTDIPRERFRVAYQTSRASKGKRPKNSLLYGTLNLRVCSRQKFQQIMGWIEGLINQSGFE